MSVRRVAVVGAGGLAKELAWLIRVLTEAGEALMFAGYVVSDSRYLSDGWRARNVIGTFDDLATAGVDCVVVGVGAAKERTRLAEEARLALPTAAESPSLVHPSVILDRSSCTIHEGVVLMPRVVATVDVALGPHCCVSYGVTIGHGSTVGGGAVLNPGCNISGDVELGRNVLVGAGAQVLEKRIVGDGSTVGAGAVVVHDVPAGVTVVGVPARPVATGPTDGPERAGQAR